jgi:hypothetical protein
MAKLVEIDENCYDHFLLRILHSRSYHSSSYRVLFTSSSCLLFHFTSLPFFFQVCLYHLLKVLLKVPNKTFSPKWFEDIALFLQKGIRSKNELVANFFLSFWKDPDLSRIVLENGEIFFPLILPSILEKFVQKQWFKYLFCFSSSNSFPLFISLLLKGIRSSRLANLCITLKRTEENCSKKNYKSISRVILTLQGNWQRQR